MAKKATKAAAAAIQITHDCTRNADGLGALQNLGLPDAMYHERKTVSELKARLLAAGFESDEMSFVEHLASMPDGGEKDELSDAWDDGSCAGWTPRRESAGWTMVAVLFIDGGQRNGEGDDAVALFARPAGMADQVPEDKPWPFPKGEGGGPDVASETVAGQVAPATISKGEAHLQRKAAQFEILDPTDALLRTFTPRVEKHGEDDVSAASLGLTIEAPNTILDLLAPSLRPTLYAAPEGQVTLPGVEESTPLLRTKVIETLKLTNCYEGWLLKISRGMDETIDISGCRVDKFVVTPRDDGSVQLDLRIGSSDISEEEAGWLYGKLRHEIEITLHAPEVKADAIDGTQAAFERDHPLADDDAQDPSAGDLFAMAHGGDDDGAPADEGSEGGVEPETAEEGAES